MRAIFTLPFLCMSLAFVRHGVKLFLVLLADVHYYCADMSMWLATLATHTSTWLATCILLLLSAILVYADIMRSMSQTSAGGGVVDTTSYNSIMKGERSGGTGVQPIAAIAADGIGCIIATLIVPFIMCVGFMMIGLILVCIFLLLTAIGVLRLIR